MVGSLALVVVLAVSAVGAESGTVADSVLAAGSAGTSTSWRSGTPGWSSSSRRSRCWRRGILAASYFLFKADAETDLSLVGGLAAVCAVCAVLAAIVSWGVTIGALTNGTVLGITVFWLVLYGAGFLLTLLPEPWPSPDRRIGPAEVRAAGASTTAGC